MQTEGSLTKNLSSLSNLMKATKSGTMNRTEVNFMLSPNSKNSPKDTLNAISISNLHKTLLGSKKAEGDILEDDGNEEANESELIIFQKYENFSEELEKIYQEKFEILEDRNKKLSEKNLELMEQMEEMNQYVSDLKEENMALGNLNEKIEDDDIQKNNEVNELKFRIAELEKRKQTSLATNQDKEDLIEGLKIENEDLRVKIAGVEGERDQLAEEVMRKNLVEDELQYKSVSLTESENVRKQLEVAIDQIRDEKKNCLEFLEKLKEENENLNSRITEVSEKMETTMKENSELKDELHEKTQKSLKVQTLELEIREYRDKVEDLSQSLSDKEYQLRQKNTQMESLEGQMEDANKKIETLKGINDAYTENLKVSQYERMIIEKESVENIGSARAKLEDLIHQRDDFKQRELRLRSQLEEKDIEINGYKLREEELKFQLDQIHDQFIDSEAKRNHLEQVFNEFSKEAEFNENELEERKIEVEEILLYNKSQMKIIQSYELLLSEISKRIKILDFSEIKLNEFDTERLDLYHLSPDRFEDDNERVIFLNNLGYFENAVKLIIDLVPDLSKEKEMLMSKLHEKNMEQAELEDQLLRLREQVDEVVKEQGTPRPRSDFDRSQRAIGSGLSKKKQVDRYRRALSDLKSIFKQCFELFENLLHDPSHVRNLFKVVSKHVETKIAIEEEEDELIQKEMMMRNSTDDVNKKDTYRDIYKAKETIRDLQDKIDFYERKQGLLLNELKMQITNYSCAGDTVKMTTNRENRFEEPNYEGFGLNKANPGASKDRKKSQKFFKVSSVDDKIAQMLDEGSERVRATIQKIRKSRYQHYGN